MDSEDTGQTAQDHDADVAVVGAGIAGLVAARKLAQKGHRVIVLEVNRRARCT